MRLNRQFPHREKNPHWLSWGTNDDNEDRIVGCHCGFKASEDDSGYGDSVVVHLQEEAHREALLEAGEFALEAHGKRQSMMALAIRLKQLADRVRS